MEAKLKQIFAQVLKEQPENISDATSQDTHATWDSLSHLLLVISIEAEFDITLEPEDILDMRSFELAKTILREKGIQA